MNYICNIIRKDFTLLARSLLWVRAGRRDAARERRGREDLHAGSRDPQRDDIDDVPWRNYVEGEPLPPDR